MSAGSALDPRESLRQQRQPPERLRVAVGVRLAGADPLDAMVHRAHARGEEQPFRRMDGGRRVEDDGARNGVRMAEQLLQLHPLVGDAGDGAELPGRERGRDGDLRDCRPGGRVAERIHLLGCADIVGEAHAHRLRAVGQRAAAEGDDEVGIGGAGGLRRRDHVPAGRVRRHAVELAGDLVAERAAQLFDLAGLAPQRAAHHEEDALNPKPLCLLRHRLLQRHAEAHRLHPARTPPDPISLHALPALPGPSIWRPHPPSILRAVPATSAHA